jgi:hypothetical protein
MLDAIRVSRRTGNLSLCDRLLCVLSNEVSNSVQDNEEYQYSMGSELSSRLAHTVWEGIELQLA